MHLRFHGFVDVPWTDSAVRRYVKDAGHLYERLNRLTRADATTQNKRKAMIFSQALDEMEERVRELKKKEDFDDWITVRWTTMWPSKNSSAGTPRFSSPILVRYQKPYAEYVSAYGFSRR